MIEIMASGKWPLNSIADVHKAWQKLGGIELKDSRTFLIGPRRLTGALDAMYEKTAWTHGSIIRQNLGLEKTVHLKTDGSFVLLYTYKIDAENYPELTFKVEAVKILEAEDT